MIVGFEDYKSNYKFKVSGVIHVGAHIGQEWQEYIDNFGEIETHWFEPIPEVYKQLENNLSDKPKTYLYNTALGDGDFTEKMYVDNGNEGQSSSILKPKEVRSQFPHIKFEESDKIEINISKLDSYNLSNCNLLALDTQGYELKVLKGSIETLKNIDYIFTEFNTIEMYEGCPTLDDLDGFLLPFDFERVETWYTSSNWGDAFYIKKNKK
jgi:FkbM family methyltransferase